jgi:hypothetical protein
MKKKPPNRYSAQRKHNEYGIRIWFSKILITNTAHQDAMIEMFLEDFGFKGDVYAQKVAFIQNRWNKFTQYVQKNYKLWLELQYN